MDSLVFLNSQQDAAMRHRRGGRELHGSRLATRATMPSSSSLTQPSAHLSRLRASRLLLMGISASLVAYQVAQQRSLALSLLDARTSLVSSSSVPGGSGNRTKDNHHQLRLRISEEATVSTAPQAVEWLDMRDFFVYLDAFSDSWYMNADLFLASGSKIEDIDGVEEACFSMFEDREDKVRMALDWLDWSVEHMSRWWKILGAPKDPYAHRRVLHYLDRYRTSRRELLRDYEPYRPLLRPTIALVAFQRYAPPKKGPGGDAALGQRCRELTVSSLAATVSSLVQVGMGRIVVVGSDREEAEERPLVYEAFELVESSFMIDRVASVNPPNYNGREAATYTKVLGSHLAYVTASNDTTFTDYEPVNMPRGALLGLHRAIVAVAGGENGVDRASSWAEAWLGAAADRDAPRTLPWRYVYLTEPDTLLHTRPRTVPGLKSMLDEGYILAPHRWQPIPYQGDVPESAANHTFVSEQQVAASLYRSVRTLDSTADACCDEQGGKKYRPGSHAVAGSDCGDAWWMCGFAAEANRSSGSAAALARAAHAGNHSRVVDLYGLIRLRQGTGVATLAGSAHGRRCLPQRGGASKCERRADHRDPESMARPTNPWITPARWRRIREDRERIARERNASASAAAPS